MRRSLGSRSSTQEPKGLIGQLGTVYSALQCSNNVVNIIFYSCIKREGLWELKTIYVRPLVILLLTKIWTPGTPLWSVFSIQEKPFLFPEECGMLSWTLTPRYSDFLSNLNSLFQSFYHSDCNVHKSWATSLRSQWLRTLPAKPTSLLSGTKPSEEDQSCQSKGRTYKKIIICSMSMWW